MISDPTLTEVIDLRSDLCGVSTAWTGRDDPLIIHSELNDTSLLVSERHSCIFPFDTHMVSVGTCTCTYLGTRGRVGLRMSSCSGAGSAHFCLLVGTFD